MFLNNRWPFPQKQPQVFTSNAIWRNMSKFLSLIFLSPGFCADGNNMLAGRHTWFSKKLHGLQWRKIKPELRKKMYPECAKRKKNHYHFTKKFISVKRFAVFLFHEKRFYKLRILAHLSNVSCGNRQFSFISQERKKQIICHSRD